MKLAAIAMQPKFLLLQDNRAGVLGIFLQGRSSESIHFQGHRGLLAIKKGSRNAREPLGIGRNITPAVSVTPAFELSKEKGAIGLGCTPQKCFAFPFWRAAGPAGR